LIREKTVEQRVENAVMLALGTRPNASIPIRMGSTPGWDSMGHMMVVMQLEKEFQISFPSYLLPNLVDLPSIVKAVQDSIAS
jgi:acyl carrier protein